MKTRPLTLLTLIFFSTVVNAAELTLFNLPLRSVIRTELRAAIEHAGGELVSSTQSEDVFNASRIGLPGASRLQVLYLGPRFVLAQYQFAEYSQTEERLRKMIVSKYGQPTLIESPFANGQSFDAQYITDGKYRWNFENDMQIVFDHPFSGADTLSYVDRAMQGELAQLLKNRESQAASAEAKQKNDAF